ncbi:hypothetical protein BDV95DRAFT_249726 [Massariosphaeria phaeospora]|uniref:Uncharacterized protein n=1 Tax=Massariosphaeria phaeospora TaxID=100035 RepID=A0A7C8HYX8_9PLEO|nr:hypothetical protein BDV95DRAFT_249726 [Massariosphaeria phaeospora]
MTTRLKPCGLDGPDKARREGVGVGRRSAGPWLIILQASFMVAPRPVADELEGGQEVNRRAPKRASPGGSQWRVARAGDEALRARPWPCWARRLRCVVRCWGGGVVSQCFGLLRAWAEAASALRYRYAAVEQPPAPACRTRFTCAKTSSAPLLHCCCSIAGPVAPMPPHFNARRPVTAPLAASAPSLVKHVSQHCLTAPYLPPPTALSVISTGGGGHRPVSAATCPGADGTPSLTAAAAWFHIAPHSAIDGTEKRRRMPLPGQSRL